MYYSPTAILNRYKRTFDTEMSYLKDVVFLKEFQSDALTYINSDAPDS